MPSPVLADAASYLSVAAQQLLPVVGLIVTAVGGVLATWLARLLARKLKIETTAEVESELERLVVQAVGFAEQFAHNKLRHDGQLVGGPAKLDEALTFARKEAERRKLPEAARDKLVELIEASLGVQRAKAATANGLVLHDTTVDKAPPVPPPTVPL